MELRPLDDDYSPYEDEEIVEGGRNPLKGIFGIALVAMIAVTGVTVAANVKLNNGVTAEFSQGKTGTQVCDTSVTVTPLSGFDNTTVPGASVNNPTINGSKISGVFTSDAVEFSDIADACLGYDLIIRAFDSTPNSTPLILTDDSSGATVDYIRIYLATPSKNFVISSSSGNFNVNASIDMVDTTTANTNTFDLIFDPGTLTADNTKLADARNVYKYTLETAPHQ